MIARRLARLVLAAALAVSGVAVGSPAFAASTPPPSPTAAVATSVTISSGIVKPNDIIRVAGSGWPARITIQASICGNNALQGASDCSPSAGGQSVTDAAGVFGLDLPIAKPPKPCPCVVHVVSPDTSATVDQPIQIIGQPTGPLDTSRTIYPVDLGWHGVIARWGLFHRPVEYFASRHDEQLARYARLFPAAALAEALAASAARS